MKEKFLVINAGSSSLKFSLYELPAKKELVNGYVEKNCDSIFFIGICSFINHYHLLITVYIQDNIQIYILKSIF